ncbi:hypothetical protein SBRCBS47491_007784 [Sporothrix bragantina]|uniref:Uncharacterized protein n=1 Tax=Sporothrix bragantina TaxID=671064 RepID=A0ABP0CGQ9_9PEZI
MAVGTLLLILGILAGGLWVMRDYQAAAIEGVLAFFDEEYYWLWTEQQFAFFVDKCLGHGSDTAAILWRCFWYNATYPFTELTDEDREQGQELDLDAWKQAITLLASDVGTGVGYGRPRYTIFGREQDIKLSRFMAMAVPRDGASPKNSPTVNDSAADKIDDDENDWHLPTELEKIAFVAATQLPIDMKFAGPHLSEVLPRVRKLVVNDGRGGSNNDGNRNVQFSADDFVIPYQDMVNLLAAVLQINEACPNTLTRSICDHELLRMPKKVGRKANRAVAEAILAAGGIRSWSAITFSMYSVFVDKLVSLDGSEVDLI